MKRMRPVEMLPTLVMARCLVALGWVHTRRETDLARLMTDFLISGACKMAEEYLDGLRS